MIRTSLLDLAGFEQLLNPVFFCLMQSCEWRRICENGAAQAQRSACLLS